MHRLDRYEMKFVVTAEQRAALMPVLLEHVIPDENGDGAYYPIVSLYYDNAHRDCYWEKMQGAGSRRKLRVRVYGSAEGKLEPACFLEVKHKCDGRVVKRRARLPLDTALRIAQGEPAQLQLGIAEAKLVDEVHRLVRDRGFEPVCCMRYDRHAWAGSEPGSDLRITFDAHIGFRTDALLPAPDDRNFSRYLLADGQSVMEVKVNGAVPYWLTRMLGEKRCVLTSHSKYCHALEVAEASLRQRAQIHRAPTANAASAAAAPEEHGMAVPAFA